MGVLSSFLEIEKSERTFATRATPATFPRRQNQKSQLTQLTQVAIAETEIEAGRKVATVATVAGTNSEYRNCGKSPASPSSPRPMVASDEDEIEERKADFQSQAVGLPPAGGFAPTPGGYKSWEDYRATVESLRRHMVAPGRIDRHRRIVEERPWR